MAVNHTPCLLTLRKRSMLWNQSAWRNFFTPPAWITRHQQCVWSKINIFVGLQEPLLAAVKRERLTCFWLTCFWHVLWYDSLSKTSPQGTLEGGWHGGDTVVGRGNAGWASMPMLELLMMVCCRKDWKEFSAEYPLMSPPPPMTQLVKGLKWTTELF